MAVRKIRRSTLRALAFTIIPQPILDSLRREAVEMAKTADVVIYIGGLNKNGFQDCESSDRREYNLPWGQDRSQFFEALQFFYGAGERGLLVRDVELHNLFAAGNPRRGFAI